MTSISNNAVPALGTVYFLETPPMSNASLPALHDRFLTMLPQIEAVARFSFRFLPRW